MIYVNCFIPQSKKSHHCVYCCIGTHGDRTYATTRKALAGRWVTHKTLTLWEDGFDVFNDEFGEYLQLVILSKEPLHYREFQFSCWWLLEQGSITWILEEWKNALFKPLRKKLGLESFFRTVSNSPFIYKHLKVTPLAMLDLSEAFDPTDHSILLETLVSGFGVSGTGLKWFTSYLSQRTQQVQIQLTLSEKKQLITGVPQGSCIGPVLCTIDVSTCSRS